MEALVRTAPVAGSQQETGPAGQPGTAPRSMALPRCWLEATPEQSGMWLPISGAFPPIPI